MPKSVIQNEALRSVLKTTARTERLSFRLPRADKVSIRRTAKSVNVTMSTYLLNLHRFAVAPVSQAKPTVIGEE